MPCCLLRNHIVTDTLVVATHSPLRRGNFTSDTNIYMVHLLREVADAHTALGHPPTKALELLDTAEKIKAAVNKHLWVTGDGDDHFITQLNHDGTTADYVDYAANTVRHIIRQIDRYKFEDLTLSSREAL